MRSLLEPALPRVHAEGSAGGKRLDQREGVAKKTGISILVVVWALWMIVRACDRVGDIDKDEVPRVPIEVPLPDGETGRDPLGPLADVSEAVRIARMAAVEAVLEDPKATLDDFPLAPRQAGHDGTGAPSVHRRSAHLDTQPSAVREDPCAHAPPEGSATMSEPPPLPDTDDPFELLGVERDASEVDLKRAYGRLIRIYRPDRHPDEFHRVRQAYEEARTMVAYEHYEYDEPAKPVQEEAPAGPSIDEEIARAWQAFEAESPDPARERLHALQREHPTEPQPAVHRFLLEDALQSSRAERLAPLLEAWRHEAPLALSLYALLNDEELMEVVLQDDFRWDRLRRRGDEAGVERLMQARQLALLRTDRLDDVEAEVLDPTFVQDSMERPYLAFIATEVKTAIAWQRPEAAQRLNDAFGLTTSGSSSEMDLEDHYVEASRLGSAWRTWRAEHPTLTPMHHFFELWPVLEQEGLRAVPAA